MASGLLRFHAPLPCRYLYDFPSTSPSASPYSPFRRNFPALCRLRGGATGAKKTIKKEGVLCASDQSFLNENAVEVEEKSVSVILLAGGVGKRMGASMPKQYLPLVGQPIALYSFNTFSQMAEVKEIIVVCDPSYKIVFEVELESDVEIKFALPGKERQDSVFNGFQGTYNSYHYQLPDLPDNQLLNSGKGSGYRALLRGYWEIDRNVELVCIHDSARPLVLAEDIRKVLTDGLVNGAAVLGVPVKATIKEAGSDSFVIKTLDRKRLWEMQTPQVIKPDLLRDGFELVYRQGLEVTDDVSIVEHLKHPVYITEGSYTNLKVTTPEDMLLAERILSTT